MKRPLGLSQSIASKKAKAKPVETENKENELIVELHNDQHDLNQVEQLQSLWMTFLGNTDSEESHLLLNGIINECDKMIRQAQVKDGLDKDILTMPFYTIYSKALYSLGLQEKELNDYMDMALYQLDIGLDKSGSKEECSLLHCTIVEIQFHKIALLLLDQESETVMDLADKIYKEHASKVANAAHNLEVGHTLLKFAQGLCQVDQINKWHDLAIAVFDSIHSEEPKEIYLEALTGLGNACLSQATCLLDLDESCADIVQSILLKGLEFLDKASLLNDEQYSNILLTRGEIYLNLGNEDEEKEDEYYAKALDNFIKLDKSLLSPEIQEFMQDFLK